MDQLELAIKYFDRRAIKTKKRNRKLLKQCSRVVSLADVKAVLGLIKLGEFQQFYDEMKENGHPSFL